MGLNYFNYQIADLKYTSLTYPIIIPKARTYPKIKKNAVCEYII